MKLRYENGLCLFTLLFLLVVPMLLFKNVYSIAEREINFEILEKGDVSGYCEENYIVVRNEDEWAEVWRRHTLIREPAETPPEVDFSKFMVVCAFMGWRPTTGYSINVEGIWTDGEKVFVEVIKRGPPEGLVVCEMVTCPYVMVLVGRTEMHFVFQVVGEGGETTEYVLDEFSSLVSVSVLFTFLFVTIIMLKIKKNDQY